MSDRLSAKRKAIASRRAKSPDAALARRRVCIGGAPASASASRTAGVAALSVSPRRTTGKKKTKEDERAKKSGLRDLAIGAHRDAVPRLEPQGGVFF